jgi:hypothetical protein
VYTITIGNQTFHFQACTIDGAWNALPALYLFHAPGSPRLFPYVGETENAATRFPDHERWQEGVKKYGVTQLLACVAPDNQDDRRRLERLFIGHFDPVMNKQHRPALGFFGGTLPDMPVGALNALLTTLPPKPHSMFPNHLAPAKSPLNAGLFSLGAPPVNKLLTGLGMNSPTKPFFNGMDDYAGVVGALARKR